MFEYRFCVRTCDCATPEVDFVVHLEGKNKRQQKSICAKYRLTPTPPSGLLKRSPG